MLSRGLLIHPIVLLGLTARLIVALSSDSVHHPDEIFQYLDQAHRLVFGYGYIPWEYRFGTRSWILPGVISAILFVSQGLGLDDPGSYIPVVKVVFCFIAVSLVYSVYAATRQLAGENAALLAAAFVSVWYEAVYFAHKPTPEVLSTYLILAALACGMQGARGAAFAGFFGAAAVALRVQYMPVVAVMALFAWLRWSRQEVLTSGLLFVLTLIGPALSTT